MNKLVGEALEREIEDYWDKRAESYSNGVRGELDDNRRDVWRHALEDVAGGLIGQAEAESRTARALDLGCGPGFFSILFADMGFAVDAVDESSEMLARARANVAEAGCGDAVAFHEGDVTFLSFDDNAFDVAACRNLTWLMRDPEAAYREWLRVLRPGGKLVVFDANWYLYLVDAEVDARRRADQEGKRPAEWDEKTQATTAEEKRCEVIAAELPLTPVARPAWDLEVLPRLGASRVRADEDAWLSLWTESEKRFYASSPMFMVEALKG